MALAPEREGIRGRAAPTSRPGVSVQVGVMCGDEGGRAVGAGWPRWGGCVCPSMC